MGFCGCSLRDSTVAAGVYGIILSVYGISWTSAVISNINSGYNYWKIYPGSIFDDVSDDLFTMYNISLLGLDKTLFGLVVFSLILHIAWILSSVALLVGNQRKNTRTLYIWVALVSIIIIADIASELYCFIRPYCSILDIGTGRSIPRMCLGYFLVGALFNKCGLITLGIQIALAIYVSQRAKEIERELQGPSQVMVISPAAQYHVGVTMQPFPADGPQTSNYQPLHREGGYGWREPAPAYTERGINRTDDLPQKGDCKDSRY